MIKVKKIYLLKRPFLTKKGQWFFVTLGGGECQTICDICHKKLREHQESNQIVSYRQSLKYLILFI